MKMPSAPWPSDVEKRLNSGEDLALGGVPYALKDLTDTAGLRTTYGSRLKEHNVPARDAAVARRLREAGGVLLGKTNTPEFGNRATTAYGLFPATRNPWDLSKTAGGSSGGSAAAVAACLAPIAEGSDGGGSIRIPSSCCGVVGIKPSRGRVSNAPNSNPRGGLITHGPIARTVRDAAFMLDIIAGPEPGDPFAAPPQTPSFLDTTERDPGSLRIGMLVTSDKWIDPQVIAAVEQTAKLLRRLGHNVEPADVDLKGLGGLFRVMVEAESAANELEDPDLFSDPYSKWCYERGRKQTAVDYIRATEEMFRRSREIVTETMNYDCLLTPTVTLTPQPLDTFLAVTERVAEDDLAFIPFTYPFNISGQPAISLPLGWTQRRPSDRRATCRASVRRSSSRRARRADRKSRAMGGQVSGDAARFGCLDRAVRPKRRCRMRRKTARCDRRPGRGAGRERRHDPHWRVWRGRWDA